MKVAYLEIKRRRVFVDPDNAEQVMEVIVSAQKTGEWFEAGTIEGERVRIHIPSEALIEIHEYELEELPGEEDLGPIDWDWMDYD